MLRRAPFLFMLLASCTVADSVPDGGALGEKAPKSEIEPHIAKLYAYEDPLDPESFANVFVMGGRKMLSIMLVAESKDGVYTGDKIGVYEVTRGAKIGGWRYDLRTPVRNHSTIDVYRVSVAPASDDTIVTVTDVWGSVARVSVNALYRWRVASATQAASIGEQAVRYRSQGGPLGGFVYFPAQASTLALDPEVPRSQLCPKYVINTAEKRDGETQRRGDEFPFGTTGYVLRWNEGEGIFQIELATPRKQ